MTSPPARSPVSAEAYDAVRKRPDLYVGPDGRHGIVGCAVHAALETGATTVTVALLPGGTVRVTADGAGLPVFVRPQEGRPWAELVLTTLFAGRATPETPGMELFAVNALSRALDLETARDGYVWRASCAERRLVRPLTRGEPVTSTGLIVTFTPDPEILGDGSYDLAALAAHLAGIEAAHPGVRIALADEADTRSVKITTLETGQRAARNERAPGTPGVAHG